MFAGAPRATSLSSLSCDSIPTTWAAVAMLRTYNADPLLAHTFRLGLEQQARVGARVGDVVVPGTRRGVAGEYCLQVSDAAAALALEAARFAATTWTILAPDDVPTVPLALRVSTTPPVVLLHAHRGAAPGGSFHIDHATLHAAACATGRAVYELDATAILPAPPGVPSASALGAFLDDLDAVLATAVTAARMPPCAGRTGAPP